MDGFLRDHLSMEIDMVIGRVVQSSTPCLIGGVAELTRYPIAYTGLLDLFAPFWYFASCVLGLNHIRGATPLTFKEVSFSSFRFHHIDSMYASALPANSAGEVVTTGSFLQLIVNLPKLILVFRRFVAA